jgi:hypothetical protein
MRKATVMIMAAYDAHDRAQMDFWLRVYEDAIAGAEATC